MTFYNVSCKRFIDLHFIFQFPAPHLETSVGLFASVPTDTHKDVIKPVVCQALVHWDIQVAHKILSHYRVFYLLWTALEEIGLFFCQIIEQLIEALFLDIACAIRIKFLPNVCKRVNIALLYGKVLD